ncbi:truncated hemoglobin YjbI [Rhodoblastus acidophilus]|uniref:group III truncated hemoglobin n=1 Tax=Rhodoblastus acidophilus TaxID=1074 RepID=UPI0022245B00|nr:group III truncated hemoglobin [Rhodoblastus acidophilus]MCW2317430.1 truncated hemoglobin YjbI [Rhodoblastus acidophilus]
MAQAEAQGQSGLPASGDGGVRFGGFAFADPPQGPGLFALTRRVGDRLFPVLIGESDDVAATLEALRTEEPALARGLADGAHFMTRDNARMRRHILRDLVGKYNPPLNVEGRTARAAPEIAALVPDRAEGDFPEAVSEDIEVSEADLDRLVRVFYRRAREDSVIGPVFDSHVSDWENHLDLVQNFWSRAFLRTERYKGAPFAPHLGLNLKPAHFERWVALFKETAAAELKPAAARAAIARAEHMSAAFQAGLYPLGHPERAP